MVVKLDNASEYRYLLSVKEICTMQTEIVHSNLKPVTFVVIGAGSRGLTYSRFALQHPDRAKVVGVAEPRDSRRESFVRQHDISAKNIFLDWQELADAPKIADVAIISTQDALHTEPAIAMAKKGYHILLEKPMAPSAKDCFRIVDSIQKTGVFLAVCHVLRYTAYTKMLKEIIDSGAIGEVVSVDHLEPIGYWHFAHSYVRGNWRNEALSSSMLLAKSCHDLDWLRYIVGTQCKKVSSFGGLYYFRADKKPIGAKERCLDCPIEEQCPYSAKSFYLGLIRQNKLDWPTNIITSELTNEGVIEALQNGPYGRCVWLCDNNVCDHQVVNMEFSEGQTASFTVTAFTEARDRQTRVFGTAGEIRGNGENIEIFDFLTGQIKRIETNSKSDGSILSGHGGGDYGIMDAYTTAVARNDSNLILSGPKESLETHLMVFASEKSRNENRMVNIREMHDCK